MFAMVYVEKKRLVFFALPWTFTTYTVKDEVITIDSGCFTTTEDDCYMYKVQDVRLETSFWEKVFGLGSVICYTGDVTSAKLVLKHIRNAHEIKDFILQTSERERRKRRTLNTQNIGAMIDDPDDIPE